MCGPSGTLQTSVGLEEEVKRERVGDGAVDNGTGGKVAGPIKVALVQTEESHVVAFSAYDKGNLPLATPRKLRSSSLTLGRYLASSSRAALSIAVYSSLICQRHFDTDS